MLKAFIELNHWLAERNLLEGVRVTIESPHAYDIIAQLKMDVQMIYDPKLDRQADNAGEIMGIPFEIKRKMNTP